MNMNIIQFQF